jgi:4'-phosphopantetheinyl transferase
MRGKTKKSPVKITPEPFLIWETDAVKVWSARLLQPPEILIPLRETLSPEEKTRANRYGTPLLQDSFITRRGLLRMLLARELECTPQSLRFRYNRFGKPELAAYHGVYFSVSSSQERALFAFSRLVPVGVDIERIDTELPFTALIEDHFAPAEKDLFHNLTSSAERLEAFFRAWTGKEACAKAVGVGLSSPLSRYDVLAAESGKIQTDLGSFSIRLLPILPTRPESEVKYCASLSQMLSMPEL